MKKKNDRNILMWILFGVVAVIAFLLPNIYSLINNFHLSEHTTKKEEVKVEVKKVTDEMISEIHFPMMRNSKYSSATYYSLDTFTNSDMSNADKLYAAFTNLENVNIANNSFKAKYLDLIIDNVLGKNIEYKLETFYVPADSSSKYKGYWNYNANKGMFIYNGGKKNENTSIEYYDLTQKIKAEYEKRDIVIYYYVGFAKVQNRKYTIYSDPKMTNAIAEGSMENTDLNEVFKKINNKVKKVYKYTFKNTICSYSEYCLYEGKWTDGI